MSLTMTLRRTGGPEELVAEDTAVGPPGAGEVQLRHVAVGVNFVDVYQRTGLYPLPAFPAVLGVEGAGVIDAVGPGVTGLVRGDRVAWAGPTAGGYTERRNLAADRAMKLPDRVDERTAAAALFRGITAHMLLRRVYPVGPGTRVLVHAAAGGLGQVLTAWARRLGATVIGTVGSRAKADWALGRGLDHAIVHREQDFVAEVRRLTNGEGVDVAYDGIGGETLLRTLDAVRPFGLVASIGQASGTLPKFDVELLGPRRSLTLARPSVLAYARDTATYRRAAAEVLALLDEGLAVTIGGELPLTDAARAHALLERGATTGSLILVP